MLFDLCGRKAEPKYNRDEEFALSLFLFCFGKREERREREKKRRYGLPGGRASLLVKLDGLANNW